MSHPIPTARGSRRRLIELGALHAISDLYQGGVPALIPFLVLSRHYSYAAGASIVAAVNLFGSIVQPAFGVWTDRRHNWWLIPSGVAVAGTGIAVVGILHSYPLTWAVVAIAGIGVAAFHPEASRSARIAAGSSATSMSIFVLGGNIGFAAGPLLVGAAVGFAGLSGTLWLAIPAWAGAAIFTLSRRGRLELSVPGSASNSVSPTQETPLTADKWRPFWLLTAAITARSICFYGITSLTALYLIEKFRVGSAEGNAALELFFIAGLVATPSGARLADRIGRVRALRAGYTLASLGIVLLALAQDLPVAFVGVLVTGLGIYVPFSVQATLGQDYLPNHLGTASGVTLGLSMSIGGIFAPVFGSLADRLGLHSVFIMLVFVPLLAVAITAGLGDRADLAGAATAASVPRTTPRARGQA